MCEESPATARHYQAAYRKRGMPLIVVIGSDSKEKARLSGNGTAADFITKLASLLGTKPNDVKTNADALGANNVAASTNPLNGTQPQRLQTCLCNPMPRLH